MNTFWFDLLLLHVYLGNPGKRLADGIGLASVPLPFSNNADSMAPLAVCFFCNYFFYRSINLIFSVKIKSPACRKQRKVWLFENLET